MKDLRNLPKMLKTGTSWEERRREIRELLADEMYGRMRLDGYQVSHSKEEPVKLRISGNTCLYQKIIINVKGLYGIHSYPDSGCGGAAVNRGKKDERITDMLHNFPHWLCLNANRFSDREDEIPFDQHMLLGLIAPRRLLVTSATLDPYCDPYSEFLGTFYAQKAYEQYGFEGIGTSIWPPADKLLMGERVAYYLRTGQHGVEDEDWVAFITFWKKETLNHDN